VRQAIAVLLAASLAASAWAAGNVHGRHMGIGFTATHVTVSFRFDDLFSRGVRAEVDKCLPTTIVATLHAHRAGDEERSAGGSARTCSITKDVWSEDHHVTIVDRSGEQRFVVRRFDEVVRLCAHLDHVPVARRSALRPGSAYRISARLQVNPLSRDSVRRIQRWLRNPEPTAGGESGSAIFGNVTSMFVRPRIGQAERTLLLRSQAFTAP
jgi:hypothetical protein